MWWHRALWGHPVFRVRPGNGKKREPEGSYGAMGTLLNRAVWGRWAAEPHAGLG